MDAFIGRDLASRWMSIAILTEKGREKSQILNNRDNNELNRNYSFEEDIHPPVMKYRTR
jgi:hypothetical protein